MRRSPAICVVLPLVLLHGAGCVLTRPDLQSFDFARLTTSDDDNGHGSLSSLPIWEDGLSEVCYYNATERIYGRDRSFTRVHMLNRQWMVADSGVKATGEDSGNVAVFKLNIAEEIPTENYNYRYLTTLHLIRPDLNPFKLVTSCQEWCGTTFKHLRWTDDGSLVVQSFSYFGEEGDRSWNLAETPTPFEALFVLSREVAATGKPLTLSLLSPMRGQHQVEPRVRTARLVPGAVCSVRVPAGRFPARRIELIWEGESACFVVEATPPYRLLEFDTGTTHGRLAAAERRAYWDRSWRSAHYQRGKAP